MIRYILVIIASSCILVSGCRSEPEATQITSVPTTSLSGYLATLSTLSDSIAESYNHYTQTTDNNDLEELSSTKELRVMTLQQINKYRSTLTSLTGYQGDSSLLDAIITDTDTLLSIMQDEEISLISLWIRMDQTDDLVSLQPLLDHEASIARMINQKIADSNTKLQEAKQLFMSTHKIKPSNSE